MGNISGKWANVRTTVTKQLESNIDGDWNNSPDDRKPRKSLEYLQGGSELFETEQETLKKFDNIKYVMEETGRSGECTLLPKHKVGIFADMRQTNVRWLHESLSSNCFTKIIKKIKRIDTSYINKKELKDKISTCTFCIFIFNGYNRKTFPALRERIGFILERKNLIVILDNLEDSSDQEKMRIHQENRSYIKYKENLILFSTTDKNCDYMNHLVNDHPPRSMRKKKKERPTVPMTSPTYPISSSQQQQKTRPDNKAESATRHPIYQQGQKRPYPDTKGYTPEHYPQKMEGHIVGIFSRCSHRDYSWLVTTLTSQDLSFSIRTVRRFHICKDKMMNFRDEVRQCTFGILYQNQNTERDKLTSIKYDLELETLCSVLGKENVIVVIDDVKDSSDSEKYHILRAQPRTAQWFRDLLLVSDLDKWEEGKLKMVETKLQKLLQGPDLAKYDQGNKRTLTRISPYDSITHQPRSQRTGYFDDSITYELRNQSTRYSPDGIEEYHKSQREEMKYHTVGIFSRSSDREYSWLVTNLRSITNVTSVKCCSISNNQFMKFMDDINQCTFGILYHSKNRGRVNVTNVTDSLYDEELETLHAILGKDNVVVIIDDLEDSSDFRKNQILQEQYNIGEWAADLLLVSHSDKFYDSVMKMKIHRLKTLLQSPDSITHQPRNQNTQYPDDQTRDQRRMLNPVRRPIVDTISEDLAKCYQRHKSAPAQISAYDGRYAPRGTLI
ncbi:uncharacterized protein RB166_015753 isoform 2-T2 [Leptodactylus fuscus]|uniref:uncharacterized protein LOC142217443 isoform X2 n=1 Tax=Leptodactylus fuscus TaxID=238119 RepID=UPI003F4F1429